MMKELARKYHRLDEVPTSDDIEEEEEHSGEKNEEKHETKEIELISSAPPIPNPPSQSSLLSNHDIDSCIFIKILLQDNKSIQIKTLTINSTVQELKETILAQLKIPLNQQRLIYCGKPLIPDNKVLSDFKIMNESVIHLFPKQVPPSSATPAPNLSNPNNSHETLSPFHQIMIPQLNAVHHLPIHFDAEVGQSIREVKMWSYILVIISAMTLFSNLSFLGSTGRPGNSDFDGALNVVETLCSICGLYIGQLGLKSSATVNRETIRKYVLYLSMLAAVMIVVRILWVADVVLLAKHDLKERHEEEDEDEEEEKDKNDMMYDDYYGDAPEISDKNFLIYFAIQASIMAAIVISMWVTCVLRAYRFREVVESYEGIATRV